jgi:hypothetical protein
MSDDVNVNKVSDKLKRRAEHIRDDLEAKGLGRAQAEQEAMRRALDEQGYAAGGSNTGGESSKHANHERDHRLGSDKKAHSGQP